MPPPKLLPFKVTNGRGEEPELSSTRMIADFTHSHSANVGFIAETKIMKNTMPIPKNKRKSKKENKRSTSKHSNETDF